MHDVKMSLVINFVLHGLCFEVARALVHDVKMSFVINFVLCGLCCEVAQALVHISTRSARHTAVLRTKKGEILTCHILQCGG